MFTPPRYGVGGMSGRSSTRAVEPPIAPTNGQRFSIAERIAQAYGQTATAPGRGALPVDPVCKPGVGPIQAMPTASLPRAK